MKNYVAVVIGASAGGISALPKLFAQLPADLPAAFFVVQHLFADVVSSLPILLSRSGTIPAVHARDGQAVEPGTIYVAPPDYHLTIRQPGIMDVAYGARENLHRPAIDPLFRSAARTYGRRTVGVLLTGTRDDGVAGLMAVKMRNGVAIVQDPNDAFYAEMPQNAIDQVDDIDHVAPLEEIPSLIEKWVNHLVNVPLDDHRNEHQEAEKMEVGKIKMEGKAMQQSPESLICPECGGSMREEKHGKLLQYRCHVGHVFGLESLRSAQAEKIEQTLWAAMRAFKEQTELLQRMATRTSNQRLSEEYQRQAEASLEHASNVHEMLQHLGTQTLPDWM